jgi:hypothetical protein
MALSDTSNFRIMTRLGGTLPKIFYVLDTTKEWNAQHFVLDSIDLDDPGVKQQMDFVLSNYYLSLFNKFNKL